MTFKEIQYPPQEETHIREVMQGWFRAPVKLVSSSSYRRDALLLMGFHTVDAAPMPDEIESEVMHSLAGASLCHELSVDVREDPLPLVCGVARAKVEYLLEHSEVSPETFVCAADSMPRFTQLVLDADGECLGARAEYFAKPKSEEEAYKTLLSMFDSILAATRLFKNGMYAQLKKLSDQGEFEKATRIVGLITKAMHIELGTGVAVRLPQSSKIESFYSAMYLMPARLVDIAEGREKMSTSDLAEAVIFKMKQEGRPVTQIAGGVDYANTGVRMILDAQAAYNIKPEKGVYLGMPTEALDWFLREKASQQI